MSSNFAAEFLAAADPLLDAMFAEPFILRPRVGDDVNARPGLLAGAPAASFQGVFTDRREERYPPAPGAADNAVLRRAGEELTIDAPRGSFLAGLPKRGDLIERVGTGVVYEVGLVAPEEFERFVIHIARRA